MAILELDCREQFAVLADASGYDDYADRTAAAPVEIMVRWEVSRTEDVIASGFVVVDRVISVGSTLWLGRLADYPATPANLKQVVEYKEIPDVKGRRFRRTVTLRRMSDEVLATT